MHDESATHIALSRSPKRSATRHLRSAVGAVGAVAVSWLFCTTATLAADPTVQVTTNATLGPILVDSSGQALYTYSGDHSTTATCTGACAQAWPPLTVSAGTTPTAGPGITATVTAAPQPNGTYQVAYNGSPLYTFVGDSSPGQVTGNGVAGFSIVKVAAAPPTSPPASPTAPATQTSAPQGQTPQTPQTAPTPNPVTPAAGTGAPTSPAGASAPTPASTSAGQNATGTAAATPAPATSGTGAAGSSTSGANATGPAGSLASTGPSTALRWVAVVGVSLFVIGLVPLLCGSDVVSVVRRRMRRAR